MNSIPKAIFLFFKLNIHKDYIWSEISLMDRNKNVYLLYTLISYIPFCGLSDIFNHISMENYISGYQHLQAFLVQIKALGVWFVDECWDVTELLKHD